MMGRRENILPNGKGRLCLEPVATINKTAIKRARTVMQRIFCNLAKFITT